MVIEILIKSIMALATKLVMAAASGPLIEWAFFYIAEALVKHTKTPHDDIFLEELRKSYDKHANYSESDKRTG